VSGKVDTVNQVREKYRVLSSVLDERGRRIWASLEAKSLGRGGLSKVSAATGIARTTLYRGLAEAQQVKRSKRKQPTFSERIRRAGAGRKPLVSVDPTLLADLDALVDPVTRGDPMSPLRWTCKGTRRLAEELQKKGHRVGRETVAMLLSDELEFSLQAPRKTREGKQHPDRNAQFEYINDRVCEFHRKGQPVISVDTKKKELVGNFKNGGREWHRKGKPDQVLTHDFQDKELGKVVPHGVYDLFRNEGWVTVGTDHDTSAFAMASIRMWWKRMGSRAYPKASQLLITADAGGSNDYRRRTWKLELQKLADETGLKIAVCHFPPGTSKWNKIEHRMFCHITQNWRGRPLTSHEVIVNSIANTTTTKGLKIRAILHTKPYPKGIEVPDDVFASLTIKPAPFHGEWNYTAVPRTAEL
jgi:hypothetical protein